MTNDPVSEAIEKEFANTKFARGGACFECCDYEGIYTDLLSFTHRIAALSYARGVEDSAKLVVGWRERDWPEGFDRHTAQIIADDFKNRLTPHKDTV